jgi:hypothetical protein
MAPSIMSVLWRLFRMALAKRVTVLAELTLYLVPMSCTGFHIWPSSPKPRHQTNSNGKLTPVSIRRQNMNLAGWPLGLAAVATILVMTTAAAPAQTFHGYLCTEDCSGHEAGYGWAEQNDIEDPSDCRGNSNSFIEGCQAYATEHEDGLQEEQTNPDDEDETDPDEDAGD